MNKRTMKRGAAALAAGLLVGAGSALFAQASEGAVWSVLIRDARTTKEQRAYVESVSKNRIDGAGEFYAAALTILVDEYPALKPGPEQNDAIAAARIVARELGELGEGDAAVTRNLRSLMDRCGDPAVKANALIALGKIGDKTYLPLVIQLLEEQTANPPTDPAQQERRERIAYGAVVSLENYGDPAGYIPVFLASTGWYGASHQADILSVRDTARAALPKILEDPTDPLLKILAGSEYTAEQKYLALQTSETSTASNERKAEAAVAALSQTWKSGIMTGRQLDAQVNTRKLALDMIRRYTTDEAAVWADLERCYRRGADVNERMAAIWAMAALSPGEDAAKRLAGYLREFYDLQLAGKTLATDTELRLVRELIAALGGIGADGSSQSKPVLLMIQQSDKWTPQIRGEAQKAIDKL